MKKALESGGFRVYAPRAGRFLDGEEAVAIFGVFLHVFGKPDRGDYSGRNYDQFHDWIETCHRRGTEILRNDRELKRFVESLKLEVEKLTADYRNLLATAESHGWSADAPYHPDAMRRTLLETAGLSASAKQTIQSQYFDRIIKERMEQGDPFTLGYIINTATSLDWNVLDLFYRVAAFATFKPWFDLAEKGEDEGPICNLGLISQYLSGFLEKYSSILTASYLARDIFRRQFFSEYLYALHQRGESEYEDAEDPFPKGRIPFLTVHQSKGLEFPVVVLGSVSKRDKAQSLEETIRPLLDRPGEPLDRSPEFDNMRMFYVALSRAQNLLVIAHPRGQGISAHRAFKTLLDKDFPRLPKFDLASVPEFREETREIPRIYSYTGDYLLFRKCPRQYMIFRKYGFVPSRSQMQFFGSLVHQTIEDLHQHLIASRDRVARAQTKGAGQ
jgi:DNA helicase-2/ATP-dependent DNA helicase PcrA